VEAIQSILPVVDEMIVLVGKSDDNTLECIKSIGSPKLKIHESVWDPAINKGGTVLAVETDKALELVSKDSDWAFYIQGDEVIHEKYHATIRAAAEKYKDDKKVEGLLFNYLHFYGTYDYVGDSRRWYHKEVRIIRPHSIIRSFRDAQGFRKHGKRIDVKQIDATVYHYGWVKSPKKMLEKRINSLDYWVDQMKVNEDLFKKEAFNYDDFDSLQRFTDTHPIVMETRVKAQNWQVDIDIQKKKFTLKDKFLYWFEKKTDIRLFSFRNYRII
jgi:hypothetical protein